MWIFCGQAYDGFEFRLNSRMIIARCGWNPDRQNRNHAEAWYFVWENDRFRLLHHVPPPKQVW
ncbi:MAG: hypothetical protein U0Q16_37675 [Bryobacteraceae bacterium]